MATANVYKFFDFQHEKMSVEELDSMKKFDNFLKYVTFIMWSNARMKIAPTVFLT